MSISPWETDRAEPPMSVTVYQSYLHELQADAERWRASSSIPCTICGGPCREFTVPNDVWNLVVRKGGPETNKEYLCEECYRNCVTDYVRLIEEEKREGGGKG